VGLLQLHEVDDRAEVVAEMQIAGRLDARKNPFNNAMSASRAVLFAPSMPAGAAR